MTPPVDEEQSLQEARALEDQAREQLQADGCPPCYPSNLSLPLEFVPKKYQNIIRYWKAQPGINYEVLTAQLRDWRQFRRYQERARQFYGKENFKKYNQRIRERRPERLKRTSKALQWDINKQDRAQNWLEFQYFHQKNHGALEDRLSSVESKLEEVCGDDDDELLALQNQLEYCQRLVGQHADLLDWINRVQKAPREQGSTETLRPSRLPSLLARTDYVVTSGKFDAYDSVVSLARHSKTSKFNSERRKAWQPRKVGGPKAPLVKTRYGRISKPPTRWAP